MEQAKKHAIAARGPLNLAELLEQGLVELTELCLADAAALLTVELELLEQLAAIDEQAPGASSRTQLLGYQTESGVGDVHDYVERRLVTEYLLATGVDAVTVPLVKGAPLYSHVAKDASLVAIAGDIAPDAIVHRLTSCPRLLLYGLDAAGLELRGRLFRRLVAPSAPTWPDSHVLRASGHEAGDPADLRALLTTLDRGQTPRVANAERPTPTGNRSSVAERRRARHRALDGNE